tara:strand:- start:347 stop:886 length:540 start_codon:yes stop_codon:yes gene_type:complete
MVLFILLFSLIIGGHCLQSPKQIKQLAKDNYKLVPYFAKPYFRKHTLTYQQREELIQEGYVGFMRACAKYDETKGFKLSTYSGFWVRKYMDDYIKTIYKQKELVSMDNHLFRTIPYFDSTSILDELGLENWEKELLIKKYKKGETFQSIAKEMKMSRDTLRNKYNILFYKIRQKYGNSP